MGQVVAGVAGAVVGFYVGGPTGAQWGYAIGSALYAVSQPGPHSEGPRLTDLKVTGTDYGQAIPWVRGHPRITGQIVYSTSKKQIATTTEQDSGKGGGPTYTEYTYEIDVLFLLTDNEIVGGSRIWDNGKLKWSILNGSSTETLVSSEDSDRWDRITFYGGAADQLPDPDYESAVGIGHAPAYRGRGSVFIKGLKLGSSGQLPNLTFEIVREGTADKGHEEEGWEQVEDYFLPISLTAFDNDGYYFHRPTWDAGYASDVVNVYWMKHGQAPDLQGSYHMTSPSLKRPIMGQTDASGIMVLSLSTTDAIFYEGTIGSQTIYTGINYDAFAICVVNGDRVFFASKTSTAMLVAMYDRSGGAPLDTASLLIVDTPTAMAYGGGVLYVLAGEWIYTFDSVLNHTGTLPPPFDLSTGIDLTYDGSSLYAFRPGADISELWRATVGFGGSLTWLKIGEWEKVDGSTEGASDQSQSQVNDGYWYRTVGIVLGSGPSKSLKEWRVGSATISPGDDTLRATVDALLDRAGYDGSEYDTSALDAITKPVRALAVASIGATRATLELLMQTYYFECVCSDKMYFRPRAESPVATISYDDLGASNSNEGDPDPLTIKYRNELEVPAQVALSYINVADDYQTGTAFSDRAISEQSSTTSASVALGMVPAEAKGVADAMVLDNYASLGSTTLKLPFVFPAYEPSDVVEVQGVGESFRMRLIRKKDSGGVLEFEAVIDSVDALLSAQITDDDYVPQTEVQGIATSEWESMDIPVLQDADNAPGWYLAAKKADDGMSLWPGGAGFRSWDGVAFSQIATFTDQAIFGQCMTTLQDWTGGNIWDSKSSLTVDVGEGQLASSTASAMYADLTANVLLVGSEVVRFRNAAMVSPGVYTLSGFIRGFRGTGWASTGHSALERCVLLRTTGLRRISTQASQINVPREVEVVTFNKPLSSATPEAFTDTGVALKPFAPTDLRASRDGSGNIEASWKRQTRLSFRFLSPGIDPPLGEVVEAYDAEIYAEGSYASVVRTFSVTSPMFDYTAADQMSDFGSTQAVIYVRIYQRSAILGRGYPLKASA